MERSSLLSMLALSQKWLRLTILLHPIKDVSCRITTTLFAWILRVTIHLALSSYRVILRLFKPLLLLILGIPLTVLHLLVLALSSLVLSLSLRSLACLFLLQCLGTCK